MNNPADISTTAVWEYYSSDGVLSIGVEAPTVSCIESTGDTKFSRYSKKNEYTDTYICLDILPILLENHYKIIPVFVETRSIDVLIYYFVLILIID